MTYEETIAQIKTLPFGEVEKVFKTPSEFPEGVELETMQAQYEVEGHKVFNPASRKMKDVTRPTGKKDSEGNDVTENIKQEVVRIGGPYQKLIVNRSVGFMLGNPIVLKSTISRESITDKTDKITEMVKKVFDDNKMEFKNREIFRTLLKECEVAELWYTAEDEGYWGEYAKSKVKPKLKILSPSRGDLLYPKFDSTGDMVAFTRAYQSLDESGEKIENFDIYLPEKIVKFKGKAGSVAFDSQIVGSGKIHVVYHKIDYPDWWDVESAIERFEELASNHGDINDYNGSPMTFVTGEITGFAQKGDRGKLFTGTKDAKMEVISWDHAPESIKMEKEDLRRLIFEGTQTPDISFDALKTIGDIAEATMRLMFIDAHMKAVSNWEVFGIGVQRRNNIVQGIICNIVDTTLTDEGKKFILRPEVEPYLPKNVKEMVEMAVQAKAAGLSQKTIYENVPWVKNADDEATQKADENVTRLGDSQI
jgi:SPP1 family phage portal protein